MHTISALHYTITLNVGTFSLMIIPCIIYYVTNKETLIVKTLNIKWVQIFFHQLRSLTKLNISHYIKRSAAILLNLTGKKSKNNCILGWDLNPSCVSQEQHFACKMISVLYGLCAVVNIVFIYNK